MPVNVMHFVVDHQALQQQLFEGTVTGCSNKRLQSGSGELLYFLTNRSSVISGMAARISKPLDSIYQKRFATKRDHDQVETIFCKEVIGRLWGCLFRRTWKGTLGADRREFWDVSFEHLRHSSGATRTKGIIFKAVQGWQLAIPKAKISAVSH